MIIVVDPVQAEAELGAGRLGCPHCGGQLAAHRRLVGPARAHGA